MSAWRTLVLGAVTEGSDVGKGQRELVIVLTRGMVKWVAGPSVGVQPYKWGTEGLLGREARGQL